MNKQITAVFVFHVISLEDKRYRIIVSKFKTIKNKIFQPKRLGFFPLIIIFY